MLNDLERKLLRILVNYLNKHGVIPSIDILEQFTGRREAAINKAILRLHDEQYIRWQPEAPRHSRIIILEEFERKPSRWGFGKSS